MRVTDLRAEYTRDLLGTQMLRPRLSWRLESDARDVVQRSYRLRAAASAAALAEGDLLWDGGAVASDACFDVRYDGPPPGSMQRIWWDVEIVAGDGPPVRSEPAWFETGLLSPEDWRGDWLEAEDEVARADRLAGVGWVWGETSLDPRPHAFRIEFDAPADLIGADVLLAGKDHLRGVWINGVPAPLDRPFDWDTYLPFWGTLTRFDGPVRPGRNVVCALVEADTTGFFPVDGGAFAALIRLHGADGSCRRVTGSAARVSPSPPPGWTEPAFTADWPAVGPSTSWAQGDPRPGEPAMLLRTDFTARAPVVAARLYATALGAYEARINGRTVGEAILAPEISVARDHVLYQTYDVTDLVKPGANALAAIVGDGWYASPFGWRVERYGFGPAPRRLRAALRLDHADGGSEWVTTGPGWRIAPSPILQSEIYDGEIYDARLERPGWDRPGFDAAGWAQARVGEPPATRLIAQTSPTIRRTGLLRATAITEPRPGCFVVDFGQNFAGWVRLRARGLAGTAITLRFAELLTADGRADLANLRLARATDRFILAGDGGETFEPRFTYHGFRYVEIEGYPGRPTPDDVEGIVVGSACREVGEMDFGEPLLARIWRNARWSQRSNFFAVPTDCPQRDERMGWLGDIQVFLDAAAFNMEVDPFIRRFLLEARAAQRDDGGYPIVAPQPLSFPDVVTAGWSEAGVILPWWLWRRYGDTAAIDENWAAMTAWMGHVARANPDGVWRRERGLDLGDWLSVDAVRPDDETTPRALCATAYWAWCAQLMAGMAAATRRDDEAERYAALRRTIGDAYAAAFVAADGRCGNGSQTSQTLSLHMGLVPAPLRDAAAAVLAADVRSRGMKLSTGFLGTPYLLDVLADAGRLEEVSALLLQTGYPSWGYMPAQGATTVWERWNGDTGDLSMNSYNHYAFGAVVGFFYRRLAGIAPAAPGFRRIAVRPIWLPRVGRVAARYESQVGLIETRVDGDAQGMTGLALTVPPNAVAEVELPGAGWRATPPGPTLNHRDGLTRCEVGSGAHRFTRSSKD